MVDPITCVTRVANEAEISEKTKHEAIWLMNSVVKFEVSAGKDPKALAATVP
jgi:transcription initiation factor TFIIB